MKISLLDRILYAESFNKRMFKLMKDDLLVAEELLTNVMVELNEAYDLIDSLKKNDKTHNNKKVVRLDLSGH